MGKDSKITWTDHTFNPWWGCYKTARGCSACYANSLAGRWGFDVWGKEKLRRLFGDKHWNEPRKWNTAAKESGKQSLVFCGSMCDVFERHQNEEYAFILDEQRKRLWDLIEETPYLTWLLLTKRPENISWCSPIFPPRNVWFGVSASDQADLESVWCALDGETHYMNPPILFLSLEPLLSPIDLSVLDEIDAGDEEHDWWTRAPDWVIAGSESNGPCLGNLGDFKTEEAWLEGTLDIVMQCREHEIPVFVKQIPLSGKLSKDPADGWPISLRVQEFPQGR